jgi:hypothetical protein
VVDFCRSVEDNNDSDQTAEKQEPNLDEEMAEWHRHRQLPLSFEIY